MNKKLLLFFLLLPITVFTFAQQLPNSDFENWTGTAFNGNAQLAGWNGSNVKQTYMGITAYGTMVTQAGSPHSGSYCAKICNTKVEAAGIGEVAPAWLTLGTPFADISNGISGATAGTYGGKAFTYRPDTMVVWVKTSGSSRTSEDFNLVVYSWSGTSVGNKYSSKSSGCVSISTKYDEESDIRQATDKNACGTTTLATQISEGFLRSRVVYNNWTELKVPIEYWSNEVPEKINVILSAGNYPNFRANSGIYAGNTMYVDDFRFIYSSKIGELYINNKKLGSFDPNVLEYTYALGVGATEIPTMEARRSGRKLSGSEISITNGQVDGNPSIIKVTAEDGSSTTTYKIYFVAKQSENSRLAGISINGTALSNFSAYLTSYDVALPYGTTSVPEITVTKAEDAQTYTIKNCTSLPGKATITVTAQNTSYTTTYTLNFTVAALTDNTLEDILINGKSLTGFSPSKTTYKVELPVGTTADPTIEAVSAYPNGEQVIVISNNGLNGTSTIKVTPKGGTNTKTYSISFVLTASTYSYLSDLKVGGTTITGFDPETFTYSYSLPIGTTVLPAITWTQGDEYQVVSMDNSAGVDGTTKITVTAASGAQSIYKITFNTAKSTVATLADILVGGVSLSDFDSDVFSYTYELPIGTTTMPAITYVKGDDYQTVTVTSGGISGTTRIVVVSQSGTAKTYSIVFSVLQANVSTLNDIQIGGVSLSGFSSGVFEYSYSLPRGTTSLPTITWTAHDAYQTIRQTNEGVNGDTKIIVTAQTGDKSTYIIHFSVETSSNTTLSNIYIGGVALSGFQSNVRSYSYVLPIGTTTLPAITWDLADASQVAYANKGGINGITTIIVQAEDGTEGSYTITFSVDQANVATLSDLKIDGVTVSGFNPDILHYSIVLPRGTTSLPEITWTAHDDYQIIRKVDGTVNGDTKITVRAQTGTTSVYVISFSVEQSSNALLNNIFIGGVALQNFSSETFAYSETLPSGTITLPEITWAKGDNYQTVYLTTGGVNGTTTLRVVAESGAINTYSIQFSVQKSANAYLKDILLDGVSLTGFEKTKLNYTYTLADGAIQCPVITVEKENGQNIVISTPTLTGIATITVTPESGAANTYTITFSFAQSTDNRLTDLQVGGTTITDFHSETLEYTYQLPVGTTILPAITYTVGNALQKVYVTEGGVNGTTTLCVVAEDGSQSLYQIYFSVAQSANALLDGILVNGVALTGFDKNVFAYTYTLARGTTTCPTVEAVEAYGQSVEVLLPEHTGDATLKVTAENGTDKQTYTIAFAFDYSTNSLLDDIQLDGVPLSGFAAQTFEYTYDLPNGTTMLPTITYTQGDAYQTVSITKQGVNDTTYIDVVAENGSVSHYKIAFSVAQSNDTTLQSIKINGVEIAGFAANVFTYHYTLAKGTTISPIIEAVPNHSGQKISLLAPYLDGTATLSVLAEDGVSTSTYTIYFAFALSNDSTLKSISVNGTPIASFASNITNYTVDLAAGSAAPTITAERNDSAQVLSIVNNGLNGTEIIVLAESGDTETYFVHYNLLPSSNALLADIQLHNGVQFVSLTDFASDKFEYIDTLAWRTTVVPVIHPIPAVDGQVITIAYGSINDTTRIHVVAEDGIATADYHIAFPVWKSAEARLGNISLSEGTLSPDFAPDSLIYHAVLPYGTTTTPIITWEQGEDNGKTLTEQTIQLTAAALDDTTRLLVTAEDGSQLTYSITFEVPESTADNVLTALIVDGIGELLSGNSNTSFTIDLPYGTTAMPAITYSKAYPEQTVLVVNGGIYSPTIITVKSNRTDVSDKVYTLTPNVAKLSDAVLNSILVDGISIAEFEAGKFNYVVSVASTQPTITYTAAAGITVDKTVDNSKQTQFTVEDEAGHTNIYNVFVYYTADVIPNAEFDNWTKAKYNNADKPTTWNVPADGDDSFSVTATYTTGPEVNKVTSGTGNRVRLRTWSSQYSIYGSIPGLMTLGDLSLELKSANNSTMAISGGVSFRNTPESVLMVYQPVSKTKNVKNLKFTYTLSDGINTVNKTFTDATFNNTSKTMTLDVKSDITTPTTLNIIVNSAHSENPSDISFTGGVNFFAGMKQESDVYVDKLSLVYSSKISKLFANGTELSGFDGEIGTQTFLVDADFQGTPVLSAEGDVPDQAYEFNIGTSESLAGSYQTRTNLITSTAEDGTTTDYTVILKRPLSTNKSLAGISIDGVAVSDFAIDQLDYNDTIANGTMFVPDIAVIKGSMHQTVSIAYTLEQAVITVTAENGAVQDYTIHFIEAKSDNTKLSNIAVSGLTFDADTRDYVVNLDYAVALPTVGFTKVSEGQTVKMTVGETTTLEVTAENGTDKGIYTVQFVRNAQVTSGQLTQITANDFLLDDFDKATYTYATNKNAGEIIETTFTREYAADTVVQTITDDSVMWAVNGTELHTYQLNYDAVLSNNAYLSAILVDGDTLTSFNAYTLDYVVLADALVSVTAIAGVDGQTISTSFTSVGSSVKTLGTFQFTVTAPDGVTQKEYAVEMELSRSSNADLAAIMLDGETISTTSANYAANHNFDANTLEYSILLPCDNPKVVQQTMPGLSVCAGADGQTIVIENNGLGKTSYITVTAEDGTTQKIYFVVVNAEKSSNATLSAIAINYVEITEFRPDNLSYTVQLTDNAQPAVTFSSNDRFQTVTTYATNEAIALQVEAENGAKQTYVVTLESPLLSDATLANIEVDGYTIGFKADSTTYVVTLPNGTSITPNIYITKGSDAQQVVIENNGVGHTSYITVTAEDGISTMVYELTLKVEKSHNADLSGITINNIPLSGFRSDSIYYEYTLTESAPEINYLKGDEKQVVSKTVNNDTTFIDVTAEDGVTVKRYTIVFINTLSGNNLLANITVEGYDIGFLPTTFNYVVELPAGVTTTPNMTILKGEDSQTVLLTRNTVRDTTCIKVAAENGDVQLYTVYFNVSLSKIDTLAMIYLGGDSLDGFSPTIFQYDITLPAGTRTLPFITYTKADNYQTIVLDTISNGKYASQINLVVTAENGDSNIYKLNFTVEKSTNNTLQDIIINSESLKVDAASFSSDADFVGEKFRYHITWPIGTRLLPTVEFVAGDSLQTVSFEHTAETLNDSTVILVTAESGVQNRYVLQHELLLSIADTLQMIYLLGDSLEAFAGSTFEYNITLPVGTRTLPFISYDAADIYQTVVMDTVALGKYQSEINLIVTAEDSTHTNTYKLFFRVEKSTDVTLKDIVVNDESLKTNALGFTSDADFAADRFHYHITWPIGTRTLPTVDFVAGDSLQTVSLEHTARTLNDSTVILVTAEDNTQNRYVLQHELLLSSVDTLKNIFIDNIPLEGFQAYKTEYSFVLPIGTDSLPNITWEAGDIYQTIEAVSNALNGNFVLTVTAENGTQRIYTITFSVELSHNATLSDILINGESLTDFDEDKLDYTVQLPYGTTETPIVTYVTAEDAQTVQFKAPVSLSDTAIIAVTAEDRVTVITYKVHFVVKLSDNALLAKLFLDGDSLTTHASGFTSNNNFTSENFEYYIALPYGTKTLPQITWEGQVPDYDTIYVTMPDSLPGTAIITVVSQDEMNENQYLLNFSIEKSNNNKLNNLLLNGETIEGFCSDTTYYTIIYPVGTDSTELATVKDISFVPGDDAQTITITQEDPCVILVTVIAENGDVRIYVIEMKILLSNNSLLRDIIIAGASLNDFDSTTFAYTYLLYQGDLIPEIEAVKSEESQEIDIMLNPVGEVTYITVTAEDGSYSTYELTFKYTDANPNDQPGPEDVYWQYMGNGNYKATTTANNVSIAIYDIAGRRLYWEDVPVIDANDNLKDRDAGGVTFNFPRKGNVYIYVFFYEKSKRIKYPQGKFIY